MKKILTLNRLSLICGAVLLLYGGLWSQTSVYVFANTLTKPAVIEKSLETKIAGANVKVFARYADFQALVQKDNPAVIICPPLAKDAAKIGGQIALSGVAKGGTEQNMLWVSIDQEFDLAANKGANIGLLDLAGRAPMRGFLSKVAGGDAKIKLASKLEDLLPMLTFKSADAVLVTESDFDAIKSRSQATLKTKSAGTKMGNLVVINNGAGADKAVASIKGLSKNELSMLGIEQWK